jgi:hypothetical protein
VNIECGLWHRILMGLDGFLMRAVEVFDSLFQNNKGG